MNKKILTPLLFAFIGSTTIHAGLTSWANGCVDGKDEVRLGHALVEIGKTEGKSYALIENKKLPFAIQDMTIPKTDRNLCGFSDLQYAFQQNSNYDLQIEKNKFVRGKTKFVSLKNQRDLRYAENQDVPQEVIKIVKYDPETKKYQNKQTKSGKANSNVKKLVRMIDNGIKTGKYSKKLTSAILSSPSQYDFLNEAQIKKDFGGKYGKSELIALRNALILGSKK